MHSFLNWLDARTGYRRILAPLRGRVLPNGPSWWFTSASCLLWLLAIELVTGLLLMTTYSPAMTTAWASVHFIGQSAFGAFLRGLHYYTSHALIILLAVHIVRVLLTAGFRAPRELIWITGLFLMPLLIVWAVTGNPLSASHKGMAQIEVEGNILGSTPVIGSLMQRVLIGGDEVGQLTLTHLYFLHVGLFPLLAIALLAIHLGQVYRHGLAPMGAPTGGRPRPYWPYQTIRNIVVLSTMLGAIATLAWRYGAPLDAPTDVNLPHTPRPEWYFRCLFELRRHFTGDWEFVATLIIPLAVLLFFVALPFVDALSSRRFSRVLRVATVVLAVSGFGWLTWTSYARDWSDADFLASQADSQAFADRAQVLADRNEMSAEGGATLLRNDPKTQGPLLFARHCASCHEHVDAQGHGIVASEPSAPNLYGFGTVPWISGLLDPATIKGPHYFGKTRLAEGEMASAIQAKFDEAEENTDELRRKLNLVAQALAAEAALRTPSVDDRSAESVEAGIALLTGELACTDCHKFHEQGDLGSAPDLTGYGSREWLAAMIGNPQHERFYPDDKNDRMPAFAKDVAQPEANLLSPRQLDLLIDWLRGEWYEPQASALAGKGRSAN